MFARSRISLVATPALCAVLLSACLATPASAPATSAPTTAAAPSAAASSPAGMTPPATADAATLAMAMADSIFGSILVDGHGMTLYMFTKDSANTSACTWQCLVAWPPLIGKPTAGSGVDDSRIGSFTRQDGRLQATYNGWPLYYWKGDQKPGDVSGQGVNGVWYVLDGGGDPVKQ